MRPALVVVCAVAALCFRGGPVALALSFPAPPPDVPQSPFTLSVGARQATSVSQKCCAETSTEAWPELTAIQQSPTFVAVRGRAARVTLGKPYSALGLSSPLFKGARGPLVPGAYTCDAGDSGVLDVAVTATAGSEPDLLLAFTPPEPIVAVDAPPAANAAAPSAPMEAFQTCLRALRVTVRSARAKCGLYSEEGDDEDSTLLLLHKRGQALQKAAGGGLGAAFRNGRVNKRTSGLLSAVVETSDGGVTNAVEVPIKLHLAHC